MKGAFPTIHSPTLGIVVPTLNEDGHLDRLLEDLAGLEVPTRVVVADGGSADGTGRVAMAAGADIIHTPPGRSRQMNAGARAAATTWLLFLHADTRMPTAALRSLEDRMAKADPRDFGTFRLGLQGGDRFWRFIETGQHLREAVTGLVYGDQGLLVSTDLYDETGGFPHLPLMEDVEMIRRLRRIGGWRKIPAPILTSPRRYQEEGRWKGWVRNSLLISRYLAGISPHRLSRFYPPLGFRWGQTSGGIRWRSGIQPNPATRPGHRPLCLFACGPAGSGICNGANAGPGEDPIGRRSWRSGGSEHLPGDGEPDRGFSQRGSVSDQRLFRSAGSGLSSEGMARGRRNGVLPPVPRRPGDPPDDVLRGGVS